MARIAGVNIPQNKVLHVALTYIHGVGDKFSNDICTKCKLIFNKYFNPSTSNNHPCDPKFLDKRSDDNEKTIIYRYETYLEKTLPILDFYKDLNLLHQINGKSKIDEISEQIRAIIASLEAWLYESYLYK